MNLYEDETHEQKTNIDFFQKHPSKILQILADGELSYILELLHYDLTVIYAASLSGFSKADDAAFLSQTIPLSNIKAGFVSIDSLLCDH
ncbi:hypothetical protein OAT88_02275 [Gammaproteobacteria bacterium]|nr:hypothetical protein [Gammaproteobacteria bacterium]